VVPEQENQTQADAARGGSKSAASSGCKQQEQSSCYEMETGDSGTRDRRE